MGRICRSLDSLIDRLALAAMALSALLLVAMLAVISFEVAVRSTGLGNPNIALELGGYAIAAITLLSAAHGLRSGGFIRVTLIYDKLNERTQACLQILFNTVGLWYVGLLTWNLTQLALQFHQNNNVSATALGIPQYLPLIPVVLGSSVLGLVLVSDLMRAVGTLLSGGGAQRDTSSNTDSIADAAISEGPRQ